MKKYKIKINKKKFRKRIGILFIIIIGITIFAGINIFKQNKLEISSVIRNGVTMNDPKATEAIKNYFNTYYGALAKLETKDLSQYFYTEDQTAYENALINQAALDYLLAYRKASINDLTFKKCTFGLTYMDIETDKNGNLNISLDLDEAVSFRFLDDITSYMCGATHEFVLKKSSNGYKIIAHSVDDTVYQLIEGSFDKAKTADRSYTNEQLKTLMEETKNNLINTASASMTSYEKNRQAFNANPSAYAFINDTDNPYNRDKAAAYSMKWVNETKVVRNSDEWAVYDDIGGNCCNYVSQCLYAGGIPMDTIGDQVWKWYSDTPDKTASETGRSPAWTGVGDFYEYCKKNKKFGLSADVGGNIYAGDVGDVVIMTSGEVWSHVVIITQVVKDKDGNVTDYLINSNTSDRKNYPLSAYGNTVMEIIRIKGWNN